MRWGLGRLIAGTIALILLVATPLMLALTVQRRVVPRLVTLFEQGVAELCGCDVAIERGRYRLFRGLDLEGVSISLTESAASVGIERIRTRVSVRGGLAVAREGRAAFAPRAGEDPWSWLERLAENGILPSRVDVRSTEISHPLLAGDNPLIIADIRLIHRGDEQTVEVVIPENSGAVTSLSVRADYGAGRISGSGELLPLPLSGLHRSIESGTITLSGTVIVERNGQAMVRGSTVVRGLSLSLPVISDQRIVMDELSYAAQAHLSPDVPVGPAYETDPPFPSLDFATGIITVTRGELTVGDLVMQVRPELRGVAGGAVPSSFDAAPLSNRATAALAHSPAARVITSVPRYLVLTVEIPETDVSRVIKAVPAAILGPLEQAEAEGTLWWRGSVRIPLHSIGWMDMDGEGGMDGFAITRLPQSMNVHRLMGSFAHTIVDPAVGYAETVTIPAAQPPPLEWLLEHSERTELYLRRIRREERESRTRPPDLVPAPGSRSATIPGGPLQPRFPYYRLAQMSDWVPRAVLTAEDGDFFFHDGVSFLTLPRAIERNLLAGEIQFGASTISMQLVKMLFLDQERLFSRKFQEVILVYLMEHYVPVPKSRILELYLNLAEFGPGIFGVGRAAEYYFNKTPAELDAGEATWLASILPSPKRYHAYFEAGSISPGWFARMQALFAVMLERGRMTDAEYQAAMQSPPLFAGPVESP
jgi:hypothetical protein